MNQTIPCPECQRSLRVPESLLGHDVMCPSCSHTFVAPEYVEEKPSRRAEPPKIDYDDQPHPSKRPVYEEEHPDDYDQAPRRSQAKPGKVHAVGVMMLVGGILACIWGMGSTLLSGFACCLWPGAYYGFVMGIMAIIKGSNLLGDKAHRLALPQGIAVMMIINIINGDLVNLTLGIISLVFLSDPEVKAYFRQ